MKMMSRRVRNGVKMRRWEERGSRGECWFEAASAKRQGTVDARRRECEE